MLSKWGLQTPTRPRRRSLWVESFSESISLKYRSDIKRFVMDDVVPLLLAFVSASLFFFLADDFDRVFSGWVEGTGMRKYIFPRWSSASGGTITIFGTHPSSDDEEGFFSTCLGCAFMISLARILPLISSTRPLECTMRITSSAPHGRMQEMQHLMVFFMAPLSWNCRRKDKNRKTKRERKRRVFSFLCQREWESVTQKVL